jgi:hypothetical protein
VTLAQQRVVNGLRVLSFFLSSTSLLPPAKYLPHLRVACNVSPPGRLPPERFELQI